MSADDARERGSTAADECPACGQAVPSDARFCPFDATPLSRTVRPPRDPLIGEVVANRYRVSARIGAGGMSVVYVARHTALDRDVALKVLRPELARGPEGIARFAREARAASRIDHDNVVYVLDFGHAEQGFHFIAMEYVPGTPLDAELARVGAMPVERVLHIVSQIAGAVGRAHELEIIHRDLKAENVMLCQRHGDPDFVKVLDFGLARSIRAESDMPHVTVPGEIFGTPEYMSPEQWEGAPADTGTDIYALGVVAYQLLTGTLPFEGNVPALLKQHLMDEPEPLTRRAPHLGIPAVLEEVVLRCLAKRPEIRFGGIPQLLAALAPVWATAKKPSRRTTYAVPPRPPADSLPDPTVYHSAGLDVIWDGPALCDEIARLHALRRKRLAELVAVLWGVTVPPQVVPVTAAIAELERALDACGEQVALLTARIEEVDRAGRELEAQCRLELINASLDVSVFNDRLPATARLAPGGGVETLPGVGPAPRTSGGPPPSVEQLDRALRDAERRLVSVLRRRRREDSELEMELAAHLAQIRSVENRLAPLYEQLSEIVQRAAGRRSELRPQLVAFGQVDGAIAAYQALLDVVATG